MPLHEVGQHLEFPGRTTGRTNSATGRRPYFRRLLEPAAAKKELPCPVSHADNPSALCDARHRGKRVLPPAGRHAARNTHLMRWDNCFVYWLKVVILVACVPGLDYERWGKLRFSTMSQGRASQSPMQTMNPRALIVRGVVSHKYWDCRSGPAFHPARTRRPTGYR